MTIQQTERAREILARLEEIDGNKAGAFTLRTEGAVGSVFEAKLAVVLEALITPSSECPARADFHCHSQEVVEAVARALCNRGHTIDRYSYALPEIKDYWRRQAEAAIAAMPSIPQDHRGPRSGKGCTSKAENSNHAQG